MWDDELMIVALYNLEPKIENTAMMQVSMYHKQRGDQVELYSPIFHEKYDLIYAFSIFSFTKKTYVRKDMICGGTGFDIQSKLPEEIQACDYDYSIFPNCKKSYVWFSRGCIRACPFCIVALKEGIIYTVKPKNLNPKGKIVSVMDNNFFASPNWKDAIKLLREWNKPVDFQVGLDVRIFNKEQGKALESIKLTKRIHIAWDNPKEDLRQNISEFCKYIKPYRVNCYVLIGYWSTPEEDIFRIEQLRKLGVDPFVMPFDKQNAYQRNLARYVNMKATFKSSKWYEYKKGILKTWIKGDLLE